MFTVYRAINKTNNKQYVGFTSRGLKIRRKEHFKEAERDSSNRIFLMAIRKYGKENFIWEVIWEGKDLEQAKVIETQMIQDHNTLAPNGYNMTDGGEAGEGALCEKEIQRRSEYMQTRWETLNYRKHITKMRKAQWKDPIYKSRMLKTHQGENNVHSVLIPSQVLEIYERVLAGERGKDLAEEFSVSPCTISKIKLHQIWKHILPETIQT